MKDIIAQIAVARGVGAEALKKWRQRGRVPHKHRLSILEEAKRRRAALTAADFDFASPQSRKKRKAA